MPNALYTREQAYRDALAANSPSVDQATNSLFGMQPGMDRLAFLPRRDPQYGWVMPNALYNAARAIASPGTAMRGGQVSPEDALNTAGYAMTGGLGASRMAPPTGPGKTLGVNAYHGTDKNFAAFDPKAKGSLTGARSARGAFWATEDPKTAQTYAVYAAEDGPVKAALDKAATYERLAQKSNSQSWWDKHQQAMTDAEALDTYQARLDRRNANSVVHKVDIPDSLDLLTVDAKGKTPWELSQDGGVDSWLGQQVDRAKAMGKSGLKVTNLDDAINLSNQPATHYAIFDPAHIKILQNK